MSDERNLGDLLPDALFNHPDCFSSCGYWRWEKEVAQPAIEAQGFEVIRWYSTDEDSFGPLVRAVDVRKDGVKQTFYYG
jgi:hypothetical protein